jgi:hypothetical protein
MKKLIAVLALLMASFGQPSAAAGAIVARVDDPEAGVSLMLFEDQGKCPDKWREALYFERGKGKVAGCWAFVSQAVVYIKFDDGDEGTLPAAALRWARSL